MNVGSSDAKVGGQFIDDVLVAARLQLGLDDPFGIGFGGVSEKAQMLRRPKSQEPIAPSGDLELKLLIVLEPGLELFLARVEGGHCPLVPRSGAL